MSATGQEARRSADTKADRRIQPPTGKPGIRQGIEQMKMPPGKTWVWFMVILNLLATYLSIWWSYRSR